MAPNPADRKANDPLPVNEMGPVSETGPVSLTGHVVANERLVLITPHMATLAQMALRVSDMLPLGADVGDFSATMHLDAVRHQDGVE
jgi:hypothetical protein